MINPVSMGGSIVTGGVGSTLTQWKLLNRTKPRQMQLLAAQPQVKREIADFRANLPKVENGQDLVKDDKVYQFVMKAFGLEDQMFAKAMIAKVLDSDMKDARSFANRMSNPRFKELALAFNFKESGSFRPDSPTFAQEIVDRFMTQRFEQQAGEANEALRLGLYFERKAKSLTSWYHVLAEPALSQVVRTSLGIPAESARIDVDRQVEMLKSKFDIKKFKDPKEVGKLVEKFMLMWDATGQGGAPESPLLTLFSANGGRPGMTGLSPSTLMAASALRRF